MLEPIYEKALGIELDARGLKYAQPVAVPAYYKGRLLGNYRVDLVVEDVVVAEVKSVITRAGRDIDARVFHRCF